MMILKKKGKRLRGKDPVLKAIDEQSFYVFLHALTNRLHEEIKKQGITYYKLAREAGISRVTISDIVTGKRKMGLETLYKLCRALNVEPARLAKGLK